MELYDHQGGMKMRHPDREITELQEIAQVFERADTIRIGMHGGD